MAYSLSNKFAKKMCKWTILVQLIVDDVVTCFFICWILSAAFGRFKLQ